MKTHYDPRHHKRLRIVQDLFAQSFLTQKKTNEITREVLNRQKELDKRIQIAAPQWPIDKIAKVDLAILRLAVYELTIAKKEPAKVIIDEAIELAKELGGEKSAPFINGVLATILKGDIVKK